MVLLACGDADPIAGESPYTLALVGDSELTLHPGEGRELQVVLTAQDRGPIASARVHFGFQPGEPAGGSLDPEESTTDDSGVATALVLAAARPVPGPFHVVVRLPACGRSP